MTITVVKCGIKWALLIALITGLIACKGFLGPHKIAIQQGNIIAQPNVDKLKLGMTPRQVKYVLGTPLLVDTLNSNEWHYIYSLRLKTGETIKKNLTVTFVDDALAQIDGDYQPSPDTLDKPNNNQQSLSDTDKQNND